jgi:hypothetical protein
MKIEGSIRSNLISAIASARRWRGRRVHKDTVAYWHAILDFGRRTSVEPLGATVGPLVAELESELALVKKHERTQARTGAASA